MLTFVLEKDLKNITLLSILATYWAIETHSKCKKRFQDNYKNRSSNKLKLTDKPIETVSKV